MHYIHLHTQYVSVSLVVKYIMITTIKEVSCICGLVCHQLAVMFIKPEKS